MKGFFLSLLLLLFLIAGCKRGEKNVDDKARRIVEKECDCFNTAGISFSERIKKVLDDGIGKSSGTYLNPYDSLDYESMEELSRFVAAVYDSASGLAKCLKKAMKEGEEGLTNREIDKLVAKRKNLGMQNTGCSAVIYYESGAIGAARYTSNNKKPNPSFSRITPDSIPLRVVIIRHAEKPDSGLNLTCKGYNRSLVLPELLVSMFGVPDYTYVPVIRIGRSTNSVRMYQTIVPFAVRYGLVVNSKHGEKDSTGLAADILTKEGTVLVVWNSTDLPRIARNLGVINKNLKWNPTDYDTIWVIDFVRTKKGRLKPKFIVTRGNIDPSPECK